MKRQLKTLIMGILNVTPDSFSDGGKWNRIDLAKRHVEDMIVAGADIIDIGAESTRPNFVAIDAGEEIARLEPILNAIIGEFSIPISIDTYKPQTAEFAINLGVEIINDVQGLSIDMAKVAAKYDRKIVVTHNQIGDDIHNQLGDNLGDNVRSQIGDDVIADIKKFFRQSLIVADEVGLNRRNIIFDPGIGFNKTQEQNLEILRRLEELKIIDGVEYPLLLGVSRKSVIGYATGFSVDDRDEATGALCVIGISKGVDIVRVHNVEMIAKMCRMADVIYQNN